MQNLTIAFIGGGNMAEALIAGLRKSGHASERIIVADPQQERRDFLASRYQLVTVEDNRQAAKQADLLVLAMKPQQMKAALTGLQAHLKQDEIGRASCRARAENIAVGETVEKEKRGESGGGG